MLNNYNKLISKEKNFNRRKLKYTLNYVSLLPPVSTRSTRLYDHIQTNKVYTNKLLVKQSYLLATWLYYLSQNSSLSSNTLLASTYKRPGFFVQPIRIYKTTMTKAPMAHKTFSQEQFLVKFYKLSLSFNLPSTEKKSSISINNSIYLLLSFRNSNLSFSSNMFFLRRTNFSLNVSDSSFFNLI